MKNWLIIFVAICAISCQNPIAQDKKFIYYLHGRIIEIQGKDAVSEIYGKYELDSITKALLLPQSEVKSEIRSTNVDPLAYAQEVSAEIDSLLKSGIKPVNITVIGASKGAIIASHISSINKNPINYVLLAGNNDYQEQHNDWQFNGNVLCFYDDSDTIAGKNYDYWKNKSKDALTFEQIKIEKSLGHGFLYQPYPEWIVPTKKWIAYQKL